jgi:hypothetical protein
MKFVIRPRQSGKTEELIAWVRQGHRTRYGWSRVIVTHNVMEAGRLEQEYHLHAGQVYDLKYWETASLSCGPVEIGIDNVDILLMMLVAGSGHIVYVTGTGEL